jgi:hypothetical protein
MPRFQFLTKKQPFSSGPRVPRYPVEIDSDDDDFGDFVSGQGPTEAVASSSDFSKQRFIH